MHCVAGRLLLPSMARPWMQMRPPQMLLLMLAELAASRWVGWWQALSGGGHWQQTGAALQVGMLHCIVLEMTGAAAMLTLQ
jgi:hypothetical protein